jgi:hypothetical protein
MVIGALISLLMQADDRGQSALSEMNDLGMLMLGGFVLAVAAAITLTVVRLRIREKKPNVSQFVSISARQAPDDE